MIQHTEAFEASDPFWSKRENFGDQLWDKARELHLQNKFDGAEELYCKLLEQNPNNIGLMATLGSLYVQKSQFGLGIHFLEGAVKGGLGDPDIYTNLGVAYKHTGQRDKAIKVLEKSIENDPTPEALTNYSAMFIEAGQSKECARLCERAIEKDPNLALAHWNLSLSLLGDGVWDRAWDEHEWGLKLPDMRPSRDVGNLPWWDGSPNKTVHIYGEQGLGDEIMFASMIPEVLKTNKVILECHPRLETLFKKSFDCVVYGTRDNTELSWPDNHEIDARLAIGSLGKFYRRKAEDFTGEPYLKADPVEKGSRLRVGIAWQAGGIKQGRIQKRSIPISWWKLILNVPGIEFVSLQHTECTDDLNMMDGLGYSIKTMDEYVKANDYYETARLVKSCDLVISVCGSVIHLAGSLGVPCWVMTPRYPAWRYQNEGKMPWYKSVRLYRSPIPQKEGWQAVIKQISVDLDDLIKDRKKLRAV